ncbi:GNAT family N-acetyltransferase [Kitasatospora sp. NBC_01300]|uniref:GNAT family N-acetyltransferase n=1 Tax=Kitasatospora sp. NBC_01300 TaxID=2903574 RepID=UPI00352EF5D6|nr:GNAT family N-acetyltransferase [Kitasatospora sp. NBC_01300]
MTHPLYVRAARPGDLDTFIRWREETAAWLRTRHGTPQWSTPQDLGRRRNLLDQGATVVAMLEPDGEPVGTCTVLPGGSDRLWTARELAVPARYLCKLNVDRRFAGQAIGARMALWARSKAAEAGVGVIRLSAWSTNTCLHAYYRSHGWRHLRTVPGIRSGALFEASTLHTAEPGVREIGLIHLPG